MTDFDPTRYTISVRKENTEEGDMFVGRVTELPDVAVYETTFKRAYDQVVDVIAVAKEMFDDDGNDFPNPHENIDREYSGRLPVRVPKALHQTLVMQAEQQGVSLNSHVNYLLTWNAAQFAQRATAEVVKPEITVHLVSARTQQSPRLSTVTTEMGGFKAWPVGGNHAH